MKPYKTDRTIKVKITGGGENYLAFGKGAVRKLLDLKLEYASQRFIIDGTKIRVMVSPAGNSVEIVGVPQGIRYQFYATGYGVSYGAPVGLGYPQVLGYSLTTVGGGKAWGSSVEADTLTPARWKYEAVPRDIADDFPIQRGFQVEGITERAFYTSVGAATKTGVSPHPMLLTSWVQSSPIVSLSPAGGTDTSLTGIDTAYDMAPSLYTELSPRMPRGPGYGLAPDADWYKSAALCTVTHPTYGTRMFIVLTDVSNVFHIYPTDVAWDDSLKTAADLVWPNQSIKTNIPAADTKSFPAPMPAWARATLASGRQWAKDNDGMGDLAWYLSDVPQYFWSFNSTGTRASCVIFEDLPIYITPVAGTYPVNNMMPASRAAPPIREALPGMLEVAINITLTGAGLRDWSASVDVVGSVRPSTANRFIVAAGYTWNVGTVAAVDDLVTLEGEVYHPSATRGGPNLNVVSAAGKTLLRVKNLTQATVIQTFVLRANNLIYSVAYPGSNVPANLWIASALLLAFDLRILGFVVQQKFTRRDAEGHDSTVERVRTYAYGKLAQSLDMDPSSLLLPSLDAVHADVDVSAMAFYPPSDVGTFNAAREYDGSFYESMDLWYPPSNSGDMHGWSAYYGYRGWDGMQFNAGGYLYAAKIATAIVPNSDQIFSVHPDGSWSIASRPIFYYAGTSTGELTDPSMFRQTYIDIISSPKTRMTHLAAFNKAFGKALVPADFMYSFSMVETTVGNFEPGHDYWVDAFSGDRIRARAHLIKATHNSEPNLVFYFPVSCKAWIYASPTGTDYTPVRGLVNAMLIVHPAYIDAVYPNWGVFHSEPAIYFSGNLATDSTGQTHYALTMTYQGAVPEQPHVPYLKGAGLFY